MLTRCPSCATTFRVTPEQLKARQGRVRCGQCLGVFDALETLIEEAPTAAAQPVPEAPPPTPPAPECGAAENTVPPAPTPDSADSAQDADEPVAAEIGTEEAASEPAGEVLADYEPTLDDMLPPEKPRRVWPWALGGALALLVLAAQALFHYRVELAVLFPETKPLLVAACGALGYELPLPRKTDLIGIETSDLHPDGAEASRLRLTATLKNRAPFAQEYPHLELSLTDTADKALLRKVLAPADYLPEGRRAADGFAARADLPLNLLLEVRNIVPVGYRLYIFHP